jgi:hypothetical protein
LATRDSKDAKGKPVGIVLKADNSVVSTIASCLETKTAYELHKTNNFIVDSANIALHATSVLKFIPQKLQTPITNATRGMYLTAGQLVYNMPVQMRNGASIVGPIMLDGSILLHGSLTCTGTGAFQSEPAALPQRSVDQLTKTIKKIFDSFKSNAESMVRSYERSRITEVKRLADAAKALYLLEANAKALHFKPASAKKIPYEFAQAEWQKYSESKLPRIDPVYSGAPELLLTKGVFWKIVPTRVNDDGSYKEDTAPVKESELVKDVTATAFTTNISDEEYKRDPYDKE